MARRIPWGRLAAEFGVIVLGVLVALAADRWREAQGEVELRQVYLDNLLLDVTADIARFDNDQQGLARRGELVLALARGAQPPPDSMGYYLHAVESLHWYDPPLAARDTYDDLQSTGGVALLTPALRRVLSQYYNRIDSYESRELLFRDRLVDGYLEVPSAVFGPDLHPKIFDQIQNDREVGDDEGSWLVNEQDFSLVAQRLRAVPDLETMIAERLYVARQHAETYGSRVLGMALELSGIVRGVLDGTLDPASVSFSDAVLQL